MELRRLREASELSQYAIAARLGCTQAHISRLELAKRTPSKSDAERLDRIFGSTEKQHFVGLRQRIVSQSGGPGWFVSWAEEIEPRALVLRSWDPLLVPGLLQTESYAREVLSKEPRTTSQQIEERVRSRIRRRGIIDRNDPPLLLFLLDACVLRREVGGREVMMEQLDYLLQFGQHPTVFLQLVDPRCLAGLSGGFMIAEMPDGEPDTIHADSSAEGQVSDRPDLAVSMWDRYEAIRLWAYPEQVSTQMIKEARQEWT
ncbi:helix-turn-helix transcriptional regulator [Sphaerisporangium corydalis]|uniref:Helix-turn-helix transcriptional regulator n=2 Tax=Sphaerisporangium corydalis TaxID=1441875 RepID=A0ABV9EDJ9_9ACTN